MNAYFLRTGYSENGHVLQGQKIRIDITGTFVSTLRVLRQASGNADDQVVAQTLSAPGVFESEIPGIYRLQCSAFTSGMVVYSIVVDAVDEVIGEVALLEFSGTLAQLISEKPAADNEGKIAYTTDASLQVSDGVSWNSVGGGGGSGDLSSNTTSSVDNELALFSGTAGKTIKRSSATGLAVLTSGVLSTVAQSGSAVGLGNVTNTSDSNKPVSTAQQAALNLKADLAGPTFTGVPAGPTAAAATNTTQLATTAFVRTEVAALVNAAPAALDTLAELSTALGGDAAFATTVTNLVAAKAPLASPTFTDTPAAPTAAVATNTTQLATTAHVFAERTSTATLSGKSISGASNTLTNIAQSSVTSLVAALAAKYTILPPSGDTTGVADRTAIQALVATFGLVPGGGRIQLTEGVYYLDTTITIPQKIGWVISGTSIEGTIIEMVPDNTPFFLFNGVTTHSWEMCYFTLRWRNNQTAANTNAIGFKFDAGNGQDNFNWEVHHIRFVNGWRGFSTTATAVTAIWGFSIHDIHYNNGMKGALIWANAAPAGQPNLIIGKLDVDASGITETLIAISSVDNIRFTDLELLNGNYTSAVVAIAVGGSKVVQLINCKIENANVVASGGGGTKLWNFDQSAVVAIGCKCIGTIITGTNQNVTFIDVGAGSLTALGIDIQAANAGGSSGNKLFPYGGYVKLMSGLTMSGAVSKNLLNDIGGVPEPLLLIDDMDMDIVQLKGDTSYSALIIDPSTTVYNEALTANRTHTLPSTGVAGVRERARQRVYKSEPTAFSLTIDDPGSARAWVIPPGCRGGGIWRPISTVWVCESFFIETGVGPSSGVYTPTLTNVANLAASTAYECQYMRVGNTVTVSGKVDVDPTTTTTSTQLGISLPIASNFAAAEDCAGVAYAPGIAAQGAGILADATNDRAQMQWVAADVTNQAMYFTFSYQVI